MKLTINHRTHDAVVIFHLGLTLTTLGLAGAVVFTAAQSSDGFPPDAFDGLPLRELTQLGIGCVAGLTLILAGLWLRLDESMASQPAIRGRTLRPPHHTVAFHCEKPAGKQLSSEPALLLAHTSTGTAGVGHEVLGEPALAASLAAPPTQPPPVVPRVILPRKLLAAIHDYINAFAARRGEHLEIGGMLVGEFDEGVNGQPAVLRLQGFIEAGPEADCQPCSLLMDEKYQARIYQAVQMQYPKIVSEGMFHEHPGNLDSCSSGDFHADREAVEHSSTGVMVFVIVTRHNPREDATSLRHGNLKFNFFVMSRATGLCYHAIRPELVDAPIITGAPALARFVAVRPDTARADWTMLRQLTGLGAVQLFEVDQGRHAGLWFTIALKGRLPSIHICLQDSGAVRLFSGTAEAPTCEFRGVWNDPAVGPYIFLSQLALHARERLHASAPVVPCSRHYAPLLNDPRRLVAEVRAMKERYGNLAELVREGDALHWRCTICQSGRRLRIKVTYPPTYPHTPPEVSALDNLEDSPHLIGGNIICWIDVYGGQSEWNPGRDTAAVAVTAAYRWFACYLVYCTLGKWPKEADH